METSLRILKQKGIPATPQRLAVARHVLRTNMHPSADEVWEAVRQECPTLSRGTVYNTLKLLADRGLLRSKVLRAGTMVFDPNTAQHHHFVDQETGRIHDIPAEAVRVSGHETLEGLEVREYEVIFRGRKREK